MNYEMGKTLEENLTTVDNLLVEQPAGLRGLFKIAGEDLVGSLRPAVEDVARITRQVGGIEIKDVNGTIKKAMTGDEIIDALHSGRITSNTMGEFYTALLKSPKTPTSVIDHIISNPKFDSLFNQVYGNMKNDPEQIISAMKQKGFPESTIDKVLEKEGISRPSASSATTGKSAGSVLSDDEFQNLTSDILSSSGAMVTADEIAPIVEKFAKSRNMKLSRQELLDVSEGLEAIIRNGTQNKTILAFEEFWGKLGPKEKYAKINSLIINYPKSKPGFAGKFFSGLLSGIRQPATKIWQTGMILAAIYHFGPKLFYKTDESMWEATWKTIAWPLDLFMKGSENEKKVAQDQQSSLNQLGGGTVPSSQTITPTSTSGSSDSDPLGIRNS